MGYISAEAVFAIAAATIAVALLIVLLMIRRGSSAAETVHVASVTLLVGATAAIAWISLVREIPQVEGPVQVNLIPFRSIRGQFSNPNSQIALVNLLGNIILYVPVGFLASVSFLRSSVGMITGAILSATMELTQLFARVGALDVDDFLLNSTGTVCGGLVSILVIRRFRDLGWDAR